jgi:hypothetical protein
VSALLRWLLPPRLLAWRNAIVRVQRLYRAKFGCAPRLLRPRTYTEKMQWRKLFDLDPQYAIFSDKLAARTFIAERAGQRWLPDLLWNGDDPESLPFETLAPPYVVKSSHGSGQVLRVHCIEDLDIAAARAQCASWLAKPYGLELGEPGYEFVPRRLMAERMLRGPDGDAPTELRAFCFDGRARLIQSVFLREGRLSHGAFHDRDWQRCYWYLTTPARPDIHPRPECLDELITLAERVAAGYDHVRVDFFRNRRRAAHRGDHTLFLERPASVSPGRGRRDPRIVLEPPLPDRACAGGGAMASPRNPAAAGRSRATCGFAFRGLVA